MDLLTLYIIAVAGLSVAAIAFPRARSVLVPTVVLVAVLPLAALLVLFWMVLGSGGHGIG